MCRIPEQRNGFLEYESPQHCPVQFRHNPFHGDGSEQCLYRTAAVTYVGVGYLVKSHKDGGKNAVHGYRYG